MMNLKRREAVWIFFVVAIVCLVAALFLLRGTSLSASAVNERLYPQANYTLRQFVDGKVEQTRTGQGDTWSIPNNESHKAQAAYFRLRCYDVDGALYYVDGKYGKSVNYHEVGLQLNTVLTRQTMTLKDASGRVLATKTDDEELQIVLEEGEYHVEITIYSSTWTRKSDGKQEYYRLDAEYKFYVDMSAPYLTGTYAEGEEQWHKIGHTVEAKDDISGDIKDFYVVRPNGELVRYYAPQRSYTFREGDLEGLYTFHAYDDAGWFSGARTVLFDGTAPIGKLSAEDGSEPESGSAVKQGFSFSATDATSGIALLEYKTPFSSDWEPYSDGTMIDSTAEAGEYLFRATDRAGNCTTSSLTLQSSDPCAEGHTYRKEIVPPTCTQGGYTHYTCTVCREETVSDRTDALGHDFREEIHEADCTNAGFTVCICTRCGTREQSGEIAALGHDYAEEIVGATCTEGGYSLYTCRRCGESYTDHITAPLGHDYITQTRQPTCTHFGGEVKKTLKSKKAIYAELLREQAKEQEKLNRLLAEVGNVLMNESSFSLETLNRAIELTKEKLAEFDEKIPTALKELNEQKSLLEHLDTYYDQFKGWAESFDAATNEEKKMIICKLISRIEVGRGYKVNIVLNMDYGQFVGNES